MLSQRDERRVCVPCRRVATGVPVCPDCRQPMLFVHHDWRAPRRRNHRAWARVAAGEWLWDRPAVEVKERRRTQRTARLTLRRARRVV